MSVDLVHPAVEKVTLVLEGLGGASSRVRGTDKAAKTWAKRLRMNKDYEYRENAAECERMARLTRDKTDKRTWLDMAQHWRSLISVPPGGSQQPGD
jgi:hypothetical protein